MILHRPKVVFMEAATLAKEIEAYKALLPSIKAKHGHVWALVANCELAGTFPAFGDAARYAAQHYGKRPVLIRHTDSRGVETAPFLHVHSEA